MDISPVLIMREWKEAKLVNKAHKEGIRPAHCECFIRPLSRTVRPPSPASLYAVEHRTLLEGSKPSTTVRTGRIPIPKPVNMWNWRSRPVPVRSV